MPAEALSSSWVCPAYHRRLTVVILSVRTLIILQYTSNKAKAHFGFVGPDWEQNTVTNFDSILNRWADQVPEYRMYSYLCTPSGSKLLVSAMGSQSRGPTLPQSVLLPLFPILSSTNCCSPTFHSFSKETIFFAIPIPRNLYQCCKIVLSRTGRTFQTLGEDYHVPPGTQQRSLHLASITW